MTIGGPIMKDRLWFFAGFAPLFNTRARTVDFGSQNGNAGNQYFTQDRQTYYLTGRLDYAATSKIRLFGSWLYQYARETGDSLPTGDPIVADIGLSEHLDFQPAVEFFPWPWLVCAERDL